MGRPHPKSLSQWERDFEVLFPHEGMLSRKLYELVSANERGHYPKQEASQRRAEQLTERLHQMGINPDEL